ncbi:hypothetical protein DC498_18630 [Terrimonas sp.]|uniref:DUF3817 domain-containing protein n=1 Tax=Terrimonas sp. TaxID=1914338 RepID=UPI000D524FF7|nr:DUF3817 domain-containing protein [Terrimonas sp.]PVD50778.1 hypothetical protein DC498_18630 [Terrimonas sp.]
MSSTLHTFRKIAFAEGVSYILLLFIAMPLKYFFNQPAAVKYVGWAHGVLFIAYVGWLIACWVRYKWSVKRCLLFFIASLLPFMPFVVEIRLKKEE